MYKPEIFLVLLFTIILLSCGAFTTYKIEGKITITNQCTNNTADIPAKLFVEKTLKFPATVLRKEKIETLNKNNIVTNPVAGAANKKVANYSFSYTERRRADEWKLKRLLTDSFADICGRITCPNPNHLCKDGATRVRSVPANDGDATPTSVKQDYEVSCSCQQPPEGGGENF